jgi:hypothetical protein
LPRSFSISATARSRTSPEHQRGGQPVARAAAATMSSHPISPADWQLAYDGDTVSLTPSIGNWGFPRRSHYWIDAQPDPLVARLDRRPDRRRTGAR